MSVGASFTHQNRRNFTTGFSGYFLKNKFVLTNSHNAPGSTEKGERACYFPWICSALEQREHRRTRNEDYNRVTRYRSPPPTLRLYPPQKTRPPPRTYPPQSL